MDEEIVWHYAVWKKSCTIMVPACQGVNALFSPRNPIHGTDWKQTINRGDVTCADCLRMMGNPSLRSLSVAEKIILLRDVMLMGPNEMFG